ncbi:MAG: GNAT family N-acetyltransferase [Chloroflexi bacterium]|nr:GNAT family N-acetyltransferase [Chloroflexota bacterium]
MISESILTTKKVRLRPLQESDLAQFQRWLADDELRRWLGSVNEQPSVAEEFDWYVSRRQDPDSILWSIESADGTLLGNVELRLSALNRRAEVAIGIFDREQWGKGYGSEAMRLVLDYAFGELKLNRVELATDEENTRAIRSYEKCGFVREGLLREHRLIDGRPVDSVAMAVIRSDWEGR